FSGTLFSGVFTHELGHAIGLRHSQTNGAVQLNTSRDMPFPFGCTSQPYAGDAGVGPTPQQIETMYPFVNQRPGGTGQYMVLLNKKDDPVAIPDLLPAAGWPGNYGPGQGPVDFLPKILGNGTGPTQQIPGVNMIARNLADPYNDCVSAMT